MHMEQHVEDEENPEAVVVLDVVAVVVGVLALLVLGLGLLGLLRP